VREVVQANQAKANEVSANYYNKHASAPSFTVNQRVLVKDERSIPGQYYKFRNKYRGFYIIDSVLPNFTFRLRDPSTNRTLPVAFHASKLRPYDDNLDRFYDRCNLTRQQATDTAILVPTDLQTDSNPGPVVSRSDNAPLAAPPVPQPQPLQLQSTQTDSPTQQTANTADDTYYEIDRILRTRRRNSQQEYYVRFKADNSLAWIPETDLTQDAIDAWRNRTRRRRRKRR